MIARDTRQKMDAVPQPVWFLNGPCAYIEENISDVHLCYMLCHQQAQ